MLEAFKLYRDMVHEGTELEKDGHAVRISGFNQSSTCYVSAKLTVGDVKEGNSPMRGESGLIPNEAASSSKDNNAEGGRCESGFETINVVRMVPI